LIFTF